MRLAHQHIAENSHSAVDANGPEGTVATRIVDTVRWMTAMQAQDLPAATWAIGLRTTGSTAHDVTAALENGSIVRSWPLRGTLHLVPAEDLRWMLSLTNERMRLRDAAQLKRLELTHADIERAREAAIAALSGRVELSRAALLAVFEAAGIATHGQRGYHTLWHLALSGTLCFGPPREKTQTFVLLDEWIPESTGLEPDEALGELALRYFSSRGPATLKDFAWWSSLTMAQARTGIAVARDAIEAREIDGAVYYLADVAGREAAPRPPSRVAPQSRNIHLLPAFDEYVLGYQDRSVALAAEHRQRVVPGNNGMFLPTIVEDGAIIGTWKRQFVAGGVRVEIAPFVSSGAVSSGAVPSTPVPSTPGPSETREALNRAASDYARFLGLGLVP